MTDGSNELNDIVQAWWHYNNQTHFFKNPILGRLVRCMLKAKDEDMDLPSEQEEQENQEEQEEPEEPEEQQEQEEMTESSNESLASEELDEETSGSEEYDDLLDQLAHQYEMKATSSEEPVDYLLRAI
jgi:hypothetical protein